MTLPERSAAAAEFLDRRHRQSGRPVAELAEELCRAGGPLAGYCSSGELGRWHGVWRRAQKRLENFQDSPEISVDPGSFEEVEAPEAGAESFPDPLEGIPGRSDSEIAGGILHFMDARLLKSGLRWRETQVFFKAGESAREATGPGAAVESRGRRVQWLAGAVLIGPPGQAPSVVVPEAKVKCERPPGWKNCRHGAVRILKMEAVRTGAVDQKATAQAVGSLLLLFRGEAGGLKTQVQVAKATGCTKANISAKERRMAGAIVKAGNKASFRGLRCKGTIGQPGK